MENEIILRGDDWRSYTATVRETGKGARIIKACTKTNKGDEIQVFYRIIKKQK